MTSALCVVVDLKYRELALTYRGDLFAVICLELTTFAILAGVCAISDAKIEVWSVTHPDDSQKHPRKILA